MMIRFIATAILLFCWVPFCFSQEQRLPRDLDKLMPRVLEFWKLSTSGQKLKASEFVLPEKREAFVSGSALSATQPRILSVEITDDPARVIVNTSVRILVSVAAGQISFTVSDPWVWSKSNWFMDLQRGEDPFLPQRSQPKINVEQVTKDLESNFKLGTEVLDLGRIVKGELRTVSVPVQYSGKEAVRIEDKLQNTLAWLDETTTSQVTESTRTIGMLFDSGEFEGPFEFSFPIAVSLNGGTIQRSFVVRGNVFAPISFKQTPATISSASLDPFEVIIRNNTNEAAPIVSIVSDGKLDVLSAPDRIEAQSEAVIRFVRISREESPPDRIWVSFSRPVESKNLYDYRLRWGLP